MTTAALTPSIEYIENGVGTVFAVPFRFRNPTHIAASRVSPANIVTPLLYGTDYSVTGGETDGGGALTVVAAAVTGTRLRIKRVTPRAQTMDYTTSDTFPAESHEGALDTAMLIDQEQDQKIDDIARRAPMVPDGQIAPALDISGLLEFDLLQYRNNKISRVEREVFAGKYYGGDAGGGIVPLSGTGVDAALRADLAMPLGPSLIGFSHAINYSPGSLGHRLKRFVCVTDAPYNAVGNGIANDTAALQAALDSGQIVYIPQGMYRVTAPLELKFDSQMVFGDGPLSVLLTTTDIETMYSVVPLFGHLICDLGFRNTVSEASGGPTKFQVHHGPNASGCKIKDCSFNTVLSGLVVRDTHHAGVWFEGANLNEILDCRFGQAHILMASTDSTIRGGFVYSFGFEYAIALPGAGEVVVDKIRGILGGPSKGCIWIPNANYMNKITGNYFGGSYTFMNTGNGVTANLSQMLQVIGNTFHEIDGIPVRLTTPVSGNLVSDNSFWATHSKQNDPTNLIAGNPDIHVENVLFASTGTTITDNIHNRFLGPIEDGMPGIGKSRAIVIDGAFQGVGNRVEGNSITGPRYFDEAIIDVSPNDIVCNNPGNPFFLDFSLTDVSGAGLVFTGINCKASRTAEYIEIYVEFTFPVTASPAGVTILGLPLAPLGTASSVYLDSPTASVVRAKFSPGDQFFFLTDALGAQTSNSNCSGRTFSFTARYRVA